MAGGDSEATQGEYTKDGSVNLKGKPILRSKSGGWTACTFVIFERMAYYGISSNLVLYLTNKLHQGTVTSANNITNWGMCLLTLAVSLPSLKPPPCGANTNDPNCTEKASSLQGVFFTALYILAIGTGSTKLNISTIGADQFDEFNEKERAHKLSFFNWWMFSIFLGTFFANTVLVYIQDNVGWTVGYALPTLGLLISIIIFIVELHELSMEAYDTNGKFRIEHTPILRILDKAAVKTGQTSSWILCPMTQQGTILDHNIGPHFKIPPACLQAFVTISMLISIVIYDRCFVPFMKRRTKNPRGITLLQRFGVASVTENQRLRTVKDHGLEGGGEVPLSIFILLPQFALMGMADAFLEVAKIELFYDQAPETMKSLGTSYSHASLGVGNFLSSYLLSTVSRVTKKNGHKGWILNNLNASHLDYYYTFFAILNLLNLLFFIILSRFYVYKVKIIIK
ncbi:Proton-dependent oligopeptide transporter family protein [Dioscorea alata]|uniref:Proton-dependent oligopeptide transporter family protein n=1 Tax=Dioscorea alata TaxID=55571 RepID=A0ACB7WRA7_DIOAL|nr:Proton-dependent oligopeptide transporter family protein [Dioscorea alata]